jgi:hypothetical protein
MTAPILVRQRADGTVLDSRAPRCCDVNTDFVADNAIKFHGSSSVEGRWTRIPLIFATEGNDVTGVPSGASVLAITDGNFSIRLGGNANGEFIDLRAQGLSVTNPAAALAGAAPQETREPEVENGVASSQAVELRNLGIFARDMDRASLVGFLEGIVLYNDVPGRIARAIRAA